jgi:hypothetical protein
MISQIEKERLAILEQLNNQGRRLERTSPDLALKFNVGLRKLAEQLATSFTGNPRGPKRK